MESAQPVEQVEKEVEAPEALIEKEEEKVEAKDEEKKIEGEKAEMKEVDNKSEEERSYLLPTPSAAPLNAQPKKFSAQKKSPWDGKNDWKKKVGGGIEKWIESGAFFCFPKWFSFHSDSKYPCLHGDSIFIEYCIDVFAFFFFA